MKEYLIKNYFVYILITIILLLICIIAYKYLNNDEDFYFNNEAKIIDKDDYTIRLNYPVFSNKNINKKVNKYIKNEKKDFKNNYVSSNDELIINYNYSKYNTLYSFHMESNRYFLDNDKKSDLIIYIDEDTNKEVLLDDIIVDKEIYSVLENKVWSYLNSNEAIKLYDEDIVKKKIKGNKENYNLLIFSSDYLFVIIPPKVVSDYQGDIIINIEYDDIINYLNDKYFLHDKKVDKEVVKKKKKRDLKEFKDKKLVAITFDDGPNYDITEKLLEELDKRNAKVSFFMLGERIIYQENLVKKIYNEGHTIGSHTYDHKNLLLLNNEGLDFEFNHTNELFKKILGTDLKYVRPPYGNYNNDILNRYDMSFILWSVDTLDWKRKDSDYVANYIINNTNDGDIVLLHDLYETSVDGAIKAIDEMINNGYAFVSLDEMAELKGVKFENNSAYHYVK